MSRILLADDSPHAQRMGERILREEGYEVVSVTDGETALIRLKDVDPDVVLADVFLPLRSGLDICQYVKGSPHHRHAKVILTAGLLETFDEEEAKRLGTDGVLRKPFEASAVVGAIKPLAEAAQAQRTTAAPALREEPDRAGGSDRQAPRDAMRARLADSAAAMASSSAAATAAIAAKPAPAPEPIPAAAIDPEAVRAAVTVALDAAMPNLIDEITERVLIALKH